METSKKEESTVKELADNLQIVATSTEVPEELNKIKQNDKEDFKTFKELYKGLIDEKFKETYPGREDEELWEDIAKEMFLKSKYYVLKGDEMKPEKVEEGYRVHWVELNNKDAKVWKSADGFKTKEAAQEFVDKLKQKPIAKGGPLQEPDIIKEDAKLEEKRKLQEDTYDSGIFQDIEQALEDAGLNPTRYIDDGVLTKNIGWTVYNGSESQQIDCPGSWYDEDEELDENKKVTESEDFVVDVDSEKLTKYRKEHPICEYCGKELTPEEIRNCHINSVGNGICTDCKYNDEINESKKVESLEQNEEDGWGDDINDILLTPIESVENMAYELRNCVRGSYAHFGDTVEDLVEAVRAIVDEFNEAADELDSYKEQLQENKKLQETTKKGIEDRKQDLYRREREALKELGDPNWENLVGLKDRLPEEQFKAFMDEEGEIRAIEMIHSILTYASKANWNEDYVMNDEYMQRYIKELGKDKVQEIVKGEVKEYVDNAIIDTDVYTDSDGITYNSVKFKNEGKERKLQEYKKLGHIDCK